jgi:uncharacterized Zn finger protein
MRERAEQKGRRYLTEGRLRILSLSERFISAECRGDGAIYLLASDAGGWSCSCPAVSDHCAHLIALRLVTVRPLPFDGIGSGGVR